MKKKKWESNRFEITFVLAERIVCIGFWQTLFEQRVLRERGTTTNLR
jgi:hypothetical protein